MSGISRRLVSSRIKTIIERCNESGTEPKDVKETNIPENITPNTTANESQNINMVTNKCSYSFNTEEELVNALYDKPYSMTTPLFDNFSETKNSYDNISKSTSLDLNLLTSSLTTTQRDGLENSNDIASPPFDLICDENMSPPSVSLLETTNILDEPLYQNRSLNFLEDWSSDDSVKDKNYYPSSTDNDESEGDSIGSKGDGFEKLQKPRKNKKNSFENTKEKENFAVPSTSCTTIQSTEEEDRPLTDLTNNVLVARQNQVVEESTTSTNDNCSITKKRKKYDKTLEARKIQKNNEKRSKYLVKSGCNEKCYKNCYQNFPHEEREIINNHYWNLSWAERRIFIKTNSAVAVPKRKTTTEPKRKPRRMFQLPKSDGTVPEVCKTFFLTTLGFDKKNDGFLYDAVHGDIKDKRGLHTKTPALDRHLLVSHVESFQPLAPHYRREHAPMRRYLPCDISITLMYKDFCEKHPSEKVSYEFYRKHLREMNISFTKLGNEECEICETNDLHCKNTSHDPKNEEPTDCVDCQSYQKHQSNYKKIRKIYDEHKSLTQDKNNVYYSTDLQKVIMIPRLDGFKRILFCPRLTSYNQSFAPLGKITNQHKPLAVLWHDGISGRKQDDIMSAYYYFIMQHRDVKNIYIWMDNCTAQNKNWLLFSLIVHLVNHNNTATETITFLYFETGHTFMSCDQFHHQVEKSMKLKGKIYDFQDFVESVAASNKSKVDVKAMTCSDFFNFPNLVSDRRIQSTTPRVYLRDIMEIRFKRGSFDMLYKTDIDSDYKSLRFMTDKYLKNPSIIVPEFKTTPKGIEPNRKNSIIQALTGITPPHKMVFWENMPIND